jgi:hypothetical protein
MVMPPDIPGLPASDWVVGLDIGQRRDYSALAVLDWIEVADGTRNPATYEFIRRKTIRLRHAERVRIGTPFAGIVDRVGQMLSDTRLQGCTLVVDATGVGAPVVELLREAKLPCRLLPVQITGGMDESSDGTYYRVPKRDLVVGLQVLFDRWPLEIASRPPGVHALVTELETFKGKRSASGNMRYEGARDDLTMALALAWWWMRKRLAWHSK